jgi:hypothetical protein
MGKSQYWLSRGWPTSTSGNASVIRLCTHRVSEEMIEMGYIVLR